jgi:hypothetical protein
MKGTDMRYALLLLMGAVAAMPALGQASTPMFPVTLGKTLAARASHYTEVSMDKNMLAFAGKFMSGSSGDDADAKKLIDKLDGIYVREYDFDKPGQYSAEDLEQIRQQFVGSQWSPMVKERSKTADGNSDIYVKLVNGQMQGLFVLDAEPTELDFVYIPGRVEPDELQKLGGSFGLPKNLGGPQAAAPSHERAR